MESPKKVGTSIITWLSLLASALTFAALAAFWIAWSRAELKTTEIELGAIYASWFSLLAFVAIFEAILAVVSVGRDSLLKGHLTVVAATVALLGCIQLDHIYASYPYSYYASSIPWLHRHPISIALPLVCLVLIGMIGAWKKIRVLRFYAWGLLICLLISLLCVPPFLFEASVRNPVSRARSDMQSLAFAIEAYHVDNNAYPVSTLDPKEQLSFAANIPLPSFPKWKPGGPATLTTPIAYITSLPLDRLSTYIHKESTFAYWAPKEGGWILLSPGPNYLFDIDFATLQKIYRSKEKNPTAELKLLTYDPTNGSRSRGDIWRSPFIDEPN